MGRSDAFYQMIAGGINDTNRMNSASPYGAFATSLLQGYMRGKREKEEREWREREMKLRENESNYRMKRLDAGDKKDTYNQWLFKTIMGSKLPPEQVDTPEELEALLSDYGSMSGYAPEERAGYDPEAAKRWLQRLAAPPPKPKDNLPTPDWKTGQSWDPDTNEATPMSGWKPPPEEPEKPRWAPQMTTNEEGSGVFNPNTEQWKSLPNGPRKAPRQGQEESGEEALRRQEAARKRATEEYDERYFGRNLEDRPARIPWIAKHIRILMGKGDQFLLERGTRLGTGMQREGRDAGFDHPPVGPRDAGFDRPPVDTGRDAGFDPRPAVQPQSTQYPPEVQRAIARAERLLRTPGVDRAEVEAALIEELAKYGYSSQ